MPLLLMECVVFVDCREAVAGIVVEVPLRTDPEDAVVQHHESKGAGDPAGLDRGVDHQRLATIPITAIENPAVVADIPEPATLTAPRPSGHRRRDLAKSHTSSSIADRRYPFERGRIGELGRYLPRCSRARRLTATNAAEKLRLPR